MSSLINVENLTLNPREVETLSAVIFKRLFQDGDLSEFHEIETGIDMKKQIVFAGGLGLLGKASVGCTPNEAEGISFTEKFWNPATEDFRLVHCQADMDKLLKIFRKAKKMNPDFYDAIGSEEFGVIIAAVEQALKENIHRKAWFNDTQAALVANGGVFKAGTDLGYWNSFDGLFKQIFIEVPANAPNRVAIAANANADYATQVLAEDEAYKTFEKMFPAADSRLLDSEDVFILATRTMVENYRATLRNKSLGAGFLERTENGKQEVYFDGIKVIQRNDWDRYIKTYQDNGTKWNLPHRAVMTVKANIPLGTLSTEDLTKLDAFYDRKDKTNIIDAVYTIESKHLESYMTVAAY